MCIHVHSGLHSGLHFILSGICECQSKRLIGRVHSGWRIRLPRSNARLQLRNRCSIRRTIARYALFCRRLLCHVFLLTAMDTAAVSVRSASLCVPLRRAQFAADPFSVHFELAFFPCRMCALFSQSVIRDRVGECMPCLHRVFCSVTDSFANFTSPPMSIPLTGKGSMLT
jgi:hypothetical protein